MQPGPVERAILAADWRASVEHPETSPQDVIDEAWAAEIQRRFDDLRAGRSGLVDWSELKAELDADLAARE